MTDSERRCETKEEVEEVDGDQSYQISQAQSDPSIAQTTTSVLHSLSEVCTITERLRTGTGSKIWLETHIWHAKRMHMIEQWGHRIVVLSLPSVFRLLTLLDSHRLIDQQRNHSDRHTELRFMDRWYTMRVITSTSSSRGTRRV